MRIQQKPNEPEPLAGGRQSLIRLYGISTATDVEIQSAFGSVDTPQGSQLVSYGSDAQALIEDILSRYTSSDLMLFPQGLTEMDIEGLTKLIEQQGSNFTRMIEQQNEHFSRLFEQQNENFNQQMAQQNAAIARIEAKVDQIADKVTDIDKRLVALESQLPHLASKSWVQVTLAVAIAGALGALGSIFTILNTVPRH